MGHSKIILLCPTLFTQIHKLQTTVVLVWLIELANLKVYAASFCMICKSLGKGLFIIIPKLSKKYIIFLKITSRPCN